MTDRAFSHEASDEGRHLTLHGPLYEPATIALRELLEDTSARQPGQVTVDLTDVDFLPSAAVGVLAVAQSKAKDTDSPVRFVAADGSISQRVLMICGLSYDQA